MALIMALGALLAALYVAYHLWTHDLALLAGAFALASLGLLVGVLHLILAGDAE